MQWITRRNLGVDRTACPWLISRFIDPHATFVFVDPRTDIARLEGHTFDMAGAEYGHEGKRCTFEALVRAHALQADAGLVEMGRIIRAADVPPSRTRRPEAAGLDAIVRGVQMSFPDDDEKLRVTAPLYDALYAYATAKSRDARSISGTPAPRLRHDRGVQVDPT